MRRRGVYILIILLWIFSFLAFGRVRQNSGYSYRIVPDKCIGCGLCIGVCPVGAISIKGAGYKPVIDPERCIRCGACLSVCPVEAVEVIR